MSLCHFDIPAQDCESIKKFYQGVFGWTFEKVAGSTDGWAISFCSKEQFEVITAGIVPRSAPTQPIGCHFRVESINEAALIIQELGGTVFVPKTAIPGQGFYACCLDPEENYFVIWEQDNQAE